MVHLKLVMMLLVVAILEELMHPLAKFMFGFRFGPLEVFSVDQVLASFARSSTGEKY
jgi:hypothetical protein